MGYNTINSMENICGSRFVKESLDNNINELETLINKHGISLKEFMGTLVDSFQHYCPSNFFGECCDESGSGLAFDIKDVKEYLNDSHPKCADICNRGLCARINRLIFNPTQKIISKYENRSDK